MRSALTSVGQDLRLALRSGWKSPTFTLVAVASIGLGVGATTAMFTLLDRVLLRPLPVRDPHQLVQVTAEGEAFGSSRGDGTELSYPMYAGLRADNPVFTDVLAMVNFGVHVGESVQPERVTAELVSGSYFPLLGLRPAQGRLFDGDDDRVPGGHPVVVLSHAFWTSRLAADPAAVGRSLLVNGRPYTIVGVGPPGFEGFELGRTGGAPQVFLPLAMKPQVTPAWNGLDDRSNRWVRVFGRLRPGLTLEQARAALEPAFRAQLRLDLADPRFSSAPKIARERHAANRLVLLPGAQGRSRFRESLGTPLRVLMGTAAGLLLIACANVANLILARGAARSREMAVRLALGATRRRLVRQLLVEHLALSVAGGAAGLAVAAFAAPLVLGLFVSPDAASPVSAAPDLRIFAFAMAVSTLTGVLFGLAPALQATRPDVAPTLQAHAGSVLGGGSARLRKVLVASQVALSLLMLMGAGLFLRTLHNLMSVDVGFQTRALVSFTLDPSLNGYAPAATKQFARRLLERLDATPGVSSASLSSIKLLDGNRWTADITIEGRPADPGENREQLCNTVGPGFFRTLGIPVLRGREFDERDRVEAAPPAGGAPSFRVAIANERFVKEYFGDQDPIGRRLGFGGEGQPTPIQIVGVVRDSRYTDVRDDVQRQLFFPYLEGAQPGQFTLYVAGSTSPAAAFTAARDVVRELDPNLPLAFARTLEQQVNRSLGRERLVATLSAVFGGLATLLAVVGLYGVVAYTVARRTREIGVRIALGASARDIRWMVIREALTVAAAGMVVAAPAAFWLSRIVRSQLYGVAAGDPATAVAAVVLLGAVSLAAGLVPSLRAARVPPTIALRYE
jgi:putative ABC transport system permease protein